MHALMRAHDWAASPLGRPEHWPASLQSVVALMLANRQLMFLAWGPDLTFLYNDGYRPTLGLKHPAALARPFRDVWPEIWGDIEPLVKKALAGGDVAFENLHLVMQRNGYAEDAWFTFSYSPVRDERGAVAGMFCAGVETTAQVLAERALRESEARTAGVLEGMGESFVLLDSGFRVLNVNAEGVRLERRPASEIIGKTYWEAWPATEHGASGPLLRRAMTERVSVSLEVQHTYPDGRAMWFELRAYPSTSGLAVFYRDVTERKHAALELQRLNAALETRVEARTAERDRLWELSEDLLVSADFEGRLLRVSPSWTRQLGHDMLTLLARPYYEITHPEDIAGVLQLLHQMRAGRRAVQFDNRMRAADGSWRWFAWTLAPDDNDNTTFYGVGRDITAVKERAAAAKRLGHERFFQAADTSGTQMGAALRATDWAATPFGAAESWPTTLRSALGIALNSAFPVCIYWGDAHRMLYNDAYSPILGAKHPAAFGQAAASIWHEIWNVLGPMFEGVRSSGRAVHTVDGLLPMQRHGYVEECYFNYNVSPIYDEEGHIAGLFNSVIETSYRVIGERRARLLRALADRSATARTAREACLAAAATVASDPADVPFCLFYLLDGAGSSHAWLAASTALPSGLASPEQVALDDAGSLWPLGHVARSLQLTPVDDFAARLGAPLVLAPWPEPIATVFVAPIADPARPGTLAGFMVAGASPRQAFDEAYRGFVTACADHVATALGNARAFEAERRAADELERRVALRTAELERAQDALRQAQKMEAVGQLTGGIAHDFNNFLAGIVGSLELMRVRIARGQIDNLERHIGAAMNSARRAAALTHRLLAFSRRQPLDPRPVDANRLAASMEDLLRRTLGPAHALEVVIAAGLWTTLCDANQLESAILNLAINARDAMPDGGHLTIETANAHLDEIYAATQGDVAPGQYVAIAITDTGAGMSAETIARATEPFFTTKPLGQGTGLGLSMVYGFVKQSQGHFNIYSELGRGTTVKLYLPRHRGAADTETAADASALVGPSVSTDDTVLVVEDEPVIRDLIVELLHGLGLRALAAADGPGGLRVLQSAERVDLLVTDVGLPGMNGRQLADQARETRPTLKVLFITGYAQNATQASGFLDHHMAMITKPFAMQALADKIESMLREP